MEDVRITLQLNDVSLRTAMQRIEDLTTFKFLAKADDVEKELHITINVSNQPLSKILDQILAGRNLEYTRWKEI